MSEQDAADLLSEVLLDFNDEFISMVEEIHMKAHMMDKRGRLQQARVTLTFTFIWALKLLL